MHHDLTPTPTPPRNPSPIRSASVIRVIRTVALRGHGTEDDIFREVTQYWDEAGNLLAENDVGGTMGPTVLTAAAQAYELNRAAAAVLGDPVSIRPMTGPSILDKLHAIESTGELHHIAYWKGTVGLALWRRGDIALQVITYHPTFEQAVEAEYDRLRLGS